MSSALETLPPPSASRRFAQDMGYALEHTGICLVTDLYEIPLAVAAQRWLGRARGEEEASDASLGNNWIAELLSDAGSLAVFMGLRRIAERPLGWVQDRIAPMLGLDKAPDEKARALVHDQARAVVSAALLSTTSLAGNVLIQKTLLGAQDPWQHIALARGGMIATTAAATLLTRTLFPRTQHAFDKELHHHLETVTGHHSEKHDVVPSWQNRTERPAHTEHGR